MMLQLKMFLLSLFLGIEFEDGLEVVYVQPFDFTQEETTALVKKLESQSILPEKIKWKVLPNIPLPDCKAEGTDKYIARDIIEFLQKQRTPWIQIG